MQMGVEDLPAEATESSLEDEDFLKKFHHALLEVSSQEHHCPVHYRNAGAHCGFGTCNNQV